MKNRKKMTSHLPMRLIGNERIQGAVCSLDNTTVADFWRWAYSDLCANNVRGVFTEWLVAKLLGLDLSGVRDSWAPCDLVTPYGTKIEVKCSAYLQTWKQPQGPSKIVFTGLKARQWDPESGYSDTPGFNADFYVFCIQIEKDKSKWNALDLDQWRFYILPRDELVRLGCKSLSLTTLTKIAREMTGSEFQQKATELIRRFEGG